MSIAEGKRLYWELAMNRKLRDTAITEQRFEDANHYGRCLQATELKVQRYLEAHAALLEGAPIIYVEDEV